MASPMLSSALVAAVGLSIAIAVAPACAQPAGGAGSRYMPREIAVFPRTPSEGQALATRLHREGFLVMARAPISGMVLAAVPVEGLEEPYCQYIRCWPEVRDAERNVAGAAAAEPVPNCPYVRPAPSPCGPTQVGAPYPPLQITGSCSSSPGAPNDPAFCLQWSMNNTGQLVVDRSGTITTPAFSGSCWSQSATPGVDVGVLPAWAYTTGSPLVTVAILDSGVEYCNPDFDLSRFLTPDLSLTCVGNEQFNYPCCDNNNPASDFACSFGPARDNVGHGTVVASIIAAKTNNNLGIAGLDQRCRILSARVFGANNTGPQGANYARANAARAVIALETIATKPAYRSVRVINISFGIPAGDLVGTDQHDALRNAVLTLRAQNRFIVAAAGNSGLGTADTLVPAMFPEVITVGAIDSRGRRVAPAYMANPLGPNTSSTGSSLDFMAPGMGEVALICQSNPCPACPYPTFPCESAAYHKNFLWGTSYAAPKVCAAISLILAEAIELGIVNPNTWQGLTWDQMYGLLRAGARDRVSHTGVAPDPLDTPGPDPYYGWGLIDIEASIIALRQTLCPSCPP